ncbi:GAF domain-containing protein [Ancylobacter amanitiformis]|uniref:GAF domain-containing protein n=1 Tax=Ancylobacter amanitiformis TaxID=217069 RepID=A0ABU0LLN9_9HYPH|nr:GAF domain-containing protein [Ancylobacter amanitiformis]MDQ0509621.1 GAF domain-containing protein [Ancylobacter amanitiformis]
MMMITADDYRQLGLAHLGARAPLDMFRAVEAVARARIGFGLLTMLRLSPDGEEVQRLYTTDPEHYPVSGRERLGPTDWGRHVLGERRPYLGPDSAAVRWAFPADFELIASLGLGATMNVPIVSLGRTLGSLNILHAAGAYDTRHLDAAVSLGPYLSAPYRDSLAEKSAP